MGMGSEFKEFIAKGNVVAQGQVLNSPEGLKDIEQHILV